MANKKNLFQHEFHLTLGNQQSTLTIIEESSVFCWESLKQRMAFFARQENELSLEDYNYLKHKVEFILYQREDLVDQLKQLLYGFKKEWQAGSLNYLIAEKLMSYIDESVTTGFGMAS